MFDLFKWPVSSLYSLLVGEQLSSIMHSVNYAAAMLGEKAIGAECGDTVTICSSVALRASDPQLSALSSISI